MLQNIKAGTVRFAFWGGLAVQRRTLVGATTGTTTK
jgi:hypothetical protein